MNIHVTPIIYVRAADELKTKPTQHSVQELRRIGINPQMLMCRTERPIPKEIRKKIAMFCDVEPDSVIEVMDSESITFPFLRPIWKSDTVEHMHSPTVAHLL